MYSRVPLHFSVPVYLSVPVSPDLSCALSHTHIHNQVNAFAPADPVRPGRGKARQEDAQEFLCFLLNALHDEFVKLTKQATPAPSDSALTSGTAAVEAGCAAPGCVCRCRSARRVVFAAGEGLSGAAPHARAP